MLAGKGIFTVSCAIASRSGNRCRARFRHSFLRMVAKQFMKVPLLNNISSPAVPSYRIPLHFRMPLLFPKKCNRVTIYSFILHGEIFIHDITMCVDVETFSYSLYLYILLFVICSENINHLQQNFLLSSGN